MLSGGTDMTNPYEKTVEVLVRLVREGKLKVEEIKKPELQLLVKVKLDVL